MSYLREFHEYGKRLCQEFLTHASLGNMSVRLNNEDMLITKTGSFLNSLSKDDLTKEKIFSSQRNPFASVELPMHREIYKNTKYQAIIHTHPTFAVTLSLILPSPITIEDSEGIYFLDKNITVVEGNVGSLKLGQLVATSLLKAKALIIKGHGVVTASENLKEAYILTSVLENSCKIKYYKLLWKKEY